VEGVGGVIFSPEGNQELTFSWILGKATNNQEEAYALLQGILLAKKHEFNSLIILRDLKVVIIWDIKLRNIFIRIHK